MTTIAITWYNDEKHFKDAQALMSDLPGTYANFLAEMTGFFDEAKKKGIELIKCPIDLDEFADHCRRNGLELTGVNRARFTVAKAFGKPINENKKIFGARLVLAFCGDNGWMVTNNEDNWLFDDVNDALSELPDGAGLVLGITRNGIDFLSTAASEEELFRQAKRCIKTENYKRRDAGRKCLTLVRVISSEELLDSIS